MKQILKKLKLNHLQYQNNQLFIENVNVSALAKKHGTPLYVYSEHAFLNPLKELQKALQPLSYTICFAMKSNSNLQILKLLKKNGCGIDTVSGGELFRCEKAKIPGKDIVLSGVGKSESELKYALNYRDTGIRSINVESEGELELLQKIAKKEKKKVKIALRFNPNINAKTHPYLSTGLKKEKFGLDKNEILNLTKKWHQFPDLELQGLSIHIGSQIFEMKPLKDAFLETKNFLLQLKERGFPIKMVDLGGGLGVKYDASNNKEKVMSIPEYGKVICSIFKNMGKDFHVCIEPGRTLSGNAGILLTKVLYEKKRGGKSFLIIDGSMSELIRPALYQAHHEIIPAILQGTKTQNTDVVGPVCESGDFLALDRDFPKSRPNDVLAVLSAGAYGMTMSSHYNTRPKPAEILVSKNKSKVIRKRETYEDLIKGE
ncbi:MAG: diaminopimelate decarboxylase [Bdellovibrionaceae bacterium]|nr:diaminopimelate decarboxylase [Pseudobdellovibrionaceae bacterium]|tara:strand:- start:7041 stop:8330 length:1290 start_codon:yes stop_codon:yes gene_type:complete